MSRALPVTSVRVIADNQATRDGVVLEVDDLDLADNEGKLKVIWKVEVFNCLANIISSKLF
jgi:hypothetical protein